RVVDGNRKVLAARLSDARFFWDVDRKKSLAEHAKGLERITFHEKLGTVADKVDRVAKLARWLVEEGIAKPTSVRPEPVGSEADPQDQRPSFTAESAPQEKSGASTSSARTVSELADMAEQAARLAKADLVTEMVGEFPELQGLMGGYYARAEGLSDAVADAIRDHYKPVGQGDVVPTAPVTVAVSLADKIDTITSFFVIDERPTGSKDPFALRRAAISVISLIVSNELRVRLLPLIFQSVGFLTEWAMKAAELASSEAEQSSKALEQFKSVLKSGPIDRLDVHLPQIKDPEDSVGYRLLLKVREYFQAGPEIALQDFVGFIADRLKVQQKEQGVRNDLIEAGFQAGNEDDLVRLLALVEALQSFMDTEDGANLLAGYKRAANILKKEDWHGIEGEIAHTGEEDPLSQVDDPDMKAVIDAKMSDRHAKELSYEPEPAEKALMDALAESEPAAAAAIDAEDFSGAMAALAALRAPIDRFFEEVTVNADEENKRAHRLDLLAAFRAAVHKVADFSRIEG
ncbi:MAG: glycine--tRNA ligase subunit beta, partial [Erythrobacter sp.]|nr:glycine--tRNA ligase subunit beta [Erythrobacter sp.]